MTILCFFLSTLTDLSDSLLASTTDCKIPSRNLETYTPLTLDYADRAPGLLAWVCGPLQPPWVVSWWVIPQEGIRRSLVRDERDKHALMCQRLRQVRSADAAVHISPPSAAVDRPGPHTSSYLHEPMDYLTCLSPLVRQVLFYRDCAVLSARMALGV